MRTLIWSSLLVIIFLAESCQEEQSSLSSTAILDQCIAASGGEKFFRSTLQFQIGDLEYSLRRDGHITDFTLIRALDTVTYKATYQNGHPTFYINDIPQNDSSLSRSFIERRLESFAYQLSFPHVLKQNAVQLTRNENVFIDDKEYYVLRVDFQKATEESYDSIFYLYINKENFLLDFVASDYELTQKNKLFRRYYNSRFVKDIRFADYYEFVSLNESLPLDQYYKAFDSLQLESVNHIVLDSIQVTYPKE